MAQQRGGFSVYGEEVDVDGECEPEPSPSPSSRQLDHKKRNNRVNTLLKNVGNVPYGVSESDLGNYFSQSGAVTNVRLVYDRETGRPKGFGFCEFQDEASAQNAINNLNGAEFNGRALRVNWANK